MKRKEAIENYRKMEIKDLVKDLKKLQDDTARLNLSNGKSRNVATYKRNKKDIARIETLISQKVGENENS